MIYQGCTYNLPVQVKIAGQAVTNKDVKLIEFTLGEVVKKYPNDATFDGEKFIISLTQEDTFKLSAEGPTLCQIRVKFNDDSVKPSKPQPKAIGPSISKEVL